VPFFAGATGVRFGTVASASSDLVVLGAGPAGLAAAWRAAERGFSVTVLERAGHVGGMAASFEVAGMRVDHGSHRLHPATPAHLLSALHRLLGDDLQKRPRNGRLRVYDRWVGFPLKAGELARAVPRPVAARIARDAATAPFRRRGGDSYAGVLSSSLGPELYAAMYAPYAEKLWGLPGQAIDAEQARVRVTADTPVKVAARVLRRQRGGQGCAFHYPRRGFGQIAEALLDAAITAGADVRLGSGAMAVHTGTGTVRIDTEQGDTLKAGRVFSTLPLPVLARLARPAAPVPALEDAASLSFRAMVLVYLVHRGGRWSPYDAHYLPGPGTPVTRISEPANYRVSCDDPPDRTVLCVEIPCTVGDGLWAADDAALAAVAKEGMASTGLPAVHGGEVVVRRLPHVYPVYVRGFAERLAGLERWVTNLPGVTTFGRLGLFAHDNSHHAMAMAYDAVDCLGEDGRWDVARWSAARERFRGHVVED
jgi:protoporphyrinogen oxidase